jgi:septal ring-binding cell division protein DamX
MVAAKAAPVAVKPAPAIRPAPPAKTPTVAVAKTPVPAPRVAAAAAQGASGPSANPANPTGPANVASPTNAGTAAGAASPAIKGRFALQLSSFPDRGEADLFAKRFAAQGAYVVVSEIPGKGTWYRVRVGSYASSQEAVAAKGSFEKQTNVIAYIAGR